MWKANVNGIKVPECKVEFSNEGKLTLHISPDFQELDTLKGLPSFGDNTFTVKVETDLVSLLCKACWLISFDLGGQAGGWDPNIGHSLPARLTFQFKRSAEDKPKPL